MSDEQAATTPVPLVWVEELVNTRSIELGTDELEGPRELAAWLRRRGLLLASSKVTAAGHRRALTVREGLRALMQRNAAEAPNDSADAEPLAQLGRLAHDLSLVLDVTVHPPRLVARRPGTLDGALATLLGAVADAAADGSWSRMKACRAPDCRWAYVDQSRNGSRAWCTMALCGNRAKARAFRRRGAPGADGT